MNRNIILLLLAMMSLVAVRCSSNKQRGDENSNPLAPKTDTLVLSTGTNKTGIGRFNDIQLTHPLDEKMIAMAEPIYNAKCIACHKLTDEKLVGPGWKGVTDRRTAEWILNFITNTQVMLDKDLSAQSLLVTCVVRMPNQDLTDEQARAMLEFLRKNDGKN